jgi:hypothetical protein
MSDPASPPPRSSSVAPASETGNGSESSLPDAYFDTHTDQSYISPAKEEASGDSEGRTENKQKRKRTRYVDTCQPYTKLVPRRMAARRFNFESEG